MITTINRDLAKAKSKAFVNIYCLLKQNTKSCNIKRSDSNEKGPKKSVGLISKTQLCTCTTLSLYISLPLVCTTTTWNFHKLPCYTFDGGNVVCVSVHFFSLPLIFTSVAASISHFLTTAIKFSGFSSHKIGLLCFLSLAVALSLFSTLIKRLKLSQKKKSPLLLLFFISKSPGGYAIYQRKARVLEMQSFTLRLRDGVDTHTDNFVRTKISWMHT